MQSAADIPVERFDDLFQGEPVDIERNLVSLRPRALAHPDVALAPQIDSQIALCQAMQHRWDEAFATLDRAEQLPGAGEPTARTRLLLERGRIFHQMRKMSEALPWFIASYELSLANNFDFHAINAAHMAAIVSPEAPDKIRWNQIAIELAESTTETKAKAWRSVLHNNIGQAYVAASQFCEALDAFHACFDIASQEQNVIVARGARWGIARAQRSLGCVKEALLIQQQLLVEYNELEQTDSLPGELLGMARGVVYEELAELVSVRSAEFARKAAADLSVNSWFRELEPTRWARILKLASIAE